MYIIYIHWIYIYIYIHTFGLAVSPHTFFILKSTISVIIISTICPIIQTSNLDCIHNTLLSCTPTSKHSGSLTDSTISTCHTVRVLTNTTATGVASISILFLLVHYSSYYSHFPRILLHTAFRAFFIS